MTLKPARITNVVSPLVLPAAGSTQRWQWTAVVSGAVCGFPKSCLQISLSRVVACCTGATRAGIVPPERVTESLCNATRRLLSQCAAWCALSSMRRAQEPLPTATNHFSLRGISGSKPPEPTSTLTSASEADMSRCRSS